jgi:hypothetical protein
MHPYEWGILGVKGLIFTRYSTVPIAHIAPVVVAVFVETYPRSPLGAVTGCLFRPTTEGRSGLKT